MAATAEFILRLVDMVTAPLKSITAQTGAATTQFTTLNDTVADFGAKAFVFNQINDAITSTAQVLNDAVAPGIAFESALADLSAITGQTDKDLDRLGNMARETALKFGGDATAQIESYKTILSRLGPDIAKSPEALRAMGESVAILSKTMGGDAAAAVDALTTGLLQFNVDLKNPTAATKTMIQQMNIMAAGSKEGAAEVIQMSAALKVAGTAAYGSNVSILEAGAALQVLAAGGKAGAEGGTALRNIMSELQKGRFLPDDTRAELIAAGVNIATLSDKTLPFTDRLRELQKVQGDAALVTKLFGTENAAGANILLRSIEAQEELQRKTAGGNVATEQANIIMNTYAERMSRMSARMKDYGVSVFNATKEYLPFISVGVQGLTVITQLAPAITLLSSGLTFLKTNFRTAAASTWTFVQSLWASAAGAARAAGQFIFTAVTGVGTFIMSMVAATATAMGFNVVVAANPIGLFVVGLLAVGAAVALVITYWDELVAYMQVIGVWLWEHHPFKFMLDLIENIFPGFKQSLVDMFNGIMNWFKNVWSKITDLWVKVKGLFSDSVAIAAPSFEGGDVNLGTTTTTTTTNDGGKPTENKPATAGLQQINKAGGGGDGGGKARIVNFTIQKIEVMARVEGSVAQAFNNFEDRVAQAVVASLMDAEQIMSSN